MAKTKLFEAWSFRLQQPAPFDDPKYAGSKSMGFSQYNTSSTAQKSTLHASIIDISRNQNGIWLFGIRNVQDLIQNICLIVQHGNLIDALTDM